MISGANEVPRQYDFDGMSQSLLLLLEDELDTGISMISSLSTYLIKAYFTYAGPPPLLCCPFPSTLSLVSSQPHLEESPQCGWLLLSVWVIPMSIFPMSFLAKQS